MSLTVGLSAYRTPFAAPLATARGPWTHREGAWVTVRDAEGRMGVGEIAPLPDWGTESLQVALEALPSNGPLDLSPDAWGVDPRRTPAAWAGLELALLDLEARRAGVSVARLLADRLHLDAPTASVPVNRLLVAESPDALAVEARDAVAAGYRTVKLKVGGRSLDAECARLASVRGAIGPDVALRLDANGGWSRDEARDALNAFKAFGPEYVEQPVAIADREGLARLQRDTGVTVAADEAAGAPDAAEASLQAGVGVLILKPAALGGLLATAEVWRRATAAGARIVVTSALDRGLQTLGALHLAAALKLDEAAGLATGSLFAPPAVPAPCVESGAVWLPEGPGLGATLTDQEVADGRLARS